MALVILTMYNQTVLYTTVSSFQVTPVYFAVNILGGIASIFGITLNVGIVSIFLKEKDLDDDVSCLLIKHLACSDLSMGLMTLYTVVYNLVHYKIVVECLVRFGLLKHLF